MKELLDRIKSLSQVTKYLLMAGLAVAVLAIVLLIVFSGSGERTISIETSLKEVIISSELKTSEYTYNSIAEIKDGDTTKYYVAYKGSVSAGIDFENVTVLREGNAIKIIVPEIKILSVKVDTDLEYIFVKEKYDTETTYAEAYAACCTDLQTKVEANQTLLTTARDSAEATLKALMKPFESQLGEDETFEIVFDAVMEGNGK